MWKKIEPLVGAQLAADVQGIMQSSMCAECPLVLAHAVVSDPWLQSCRSSMAHTDRAVAPNKH